MRAEISEHSRNAVEVDEADQKRYAQAIVGSLQQIIAGTTRMAS